MRILLATTVLGGCATRPRTRRFSASVFHSARHVGHPLALYQPGSPGDQTAMLVVDQLHAAGFRFGTDGSTGALWGYMRTSHRVVAASDARAGDIVFFDTRSREDDDLSCADRVGIVEGVDRDGRITFLEAEGAQMRRGYVNPRHPLLRRRDDGSIANSFLRPKKIGDLDGTRYFAGEMLCAVARFGTR
jgi:hypothetical protein